MGAIAVSFALVRIVSRLVVGAAAVISVQNTFAFQVLVDLNTYRKYDANSVSDVQYLKCDGVWAVPQNDGGTFTQAEWGTMLNLLGPWVVSEDNPGGHWDYDYITQAIGRPPNDAMCYNETGGTLGGTTLSDQQIIDQAATHGGSVVVLTRAGGGEWLTQLNRAFNSAQVVGGCLESPDPAVGNAPGFINDCASYGKRAYVILVGGMGTEWVSYQIQNMLNGVPALMASPNTFIVISDYSTSRSRSKWYGTTNCVQADVAAALAMAGRPTLPPAAPAGLVAAGGDHKADLSWNSCARATSYNVKRSTAFGGPYTNVVNTLGTNYTDTSLVAGVPCFYVVSAANAGGQSADSSPVSPWATPPGAWAVDAGGNWGNESNWTGYIVPSGPAITAIFSNNITGDRVVTNDAPRTVGNLVFGDADPSSLGGWTLAGASPLTLQVSSGAPVVNVSALGAGKSALIACPLAGIQGLTKAGNGTLILSGSNSYSGGTAVNGSSGTTVSLAVANGSLETPSISNWYYQNTSGGNAYNFNAVSGFGWTFGTSAGIDHNSGTWYAAGAPAPNGSQAAFIQGTSSGAKISQTINFPVTGNYTVTFSCIGRAGSFGPNTIQVQVDGNIISTVSYSSQSQSAWQNYIAPYNCTSTGNHTLAFVGARTGGDYSSSIDNVTVTSPVMGEAGKLVLGHDNALGSGSGLLTVNTNGTLDVAGHSPTVNGLAGDGGTITNSGTLATLTIHTAGANPATSLRGPVNLVVDYVNWVNWQFQGGSNDYSGTTEVKNGANLVLNATNGLGLTSAGTVVDSGGMLTLGMRTLGSDAGSYTFVPEPVTLSNNATFGAGYGWTTADSRNYTWPGVVTLVGGTVQLSADTNVVTTLTGEVTGSGGLNKVNPGTDILAYAGDEDYSGNTTVSAGTLKVAAGTTINNTPVITVNAGAVLDVKGGGLTVGSSQTLMGSGTVLGPVTVNGTLAPGGSPGTLTLSGALTLGAGSTTRVEVNSQDLTHDLVQGIATANFGGTLQVSNLAGTLAAGQSWRLFSASNSSGAFSGFSPATLGPNLGWSFNPTNATLSVISLQPPQLTQYSMASNGGFTLSGTGPDGQSYRILAATNLALALSNWSTIATGVFNGGVFQFTDLPSTNQTTRFYDVVTP
ncbi:MAG: autotransporter-associated beta strand repeat-containing protein [Verrucomicrobia bacterium]|nr:autotransporter-associated beta strand repeat-containing protein [Verrucomicrobiota bacterium]